MTAAARSKSTVDRVLHIGSGLLPARGGGGRPASYAECGTQAPHHTATKTAHLGDSGASWLHVSAPCVEWWRPDLNGGRP